MKIGVLIVLSVILISSGVSYAANGDLIVNGKLGVGTPTPSEKAEVNGNMAVSGAVKAGTAEVTGNTIVNGNLGVGTATPAGKAEVNGNMVVDGNLGVGTSTPQTKLDVNGDISFVKDGKRFVLQYMNIGEDVYSATYSCAVDTCNGNWIKYTCPVNESRVCCDGYYDPDHNPVYANVTCKAILVFVSQ